MTANYGDPAGRLEWSDLQYDLTTSAIQNWDFLVTQAVQVLHVARIIYNKIAIDTAFLGRGGGSGCRFWV